MSSDLRRVGWGAVAVVGAALLLKSPPPTWVVAIVMLAIGIDGYYRNRSSDEQ